jgi:hypothetical protein
MCISIYFYLQKSIKIFLFFFLFGVAYLSSFLCSPIMCLYVLSVRYDFLINTMIGSSFPTVVCRRAHALFTLFVFVCV